MQDVIEKLVGRDNSAEGDYTENEILMCGKCRTPKQALKELPTAGGGTRSILVSVACRCDVEDLAAQKETAKRLEFSRWVSEQQAMYGISEGLCRGQSFAQDDCRTPAISDTCHRYVERWEEMKADNMGVLFYDSVGTGKSFYACAIVNALLEKCVPATATNFPRLLNLLQGAGNRQTYIDHLQRWQLLVIDDLGVERDSSYAAEQVFNVIDARARSGLPLIVTTNLTLDEMKNPISMQYARIYDRVLEMCPITIMMNGESRRKGNAEARRAKARELLRKEDKP